MLSFAPDVPFGTPRDIRRHVLWTQRQFLGCENGSRGLTLSLPRECRSRGRAYVVLPGAMVGRGDALTSPHHISPVDELTPFRRNVSRRKELGCKSSLTNDFQHRGESCPRLVPTHLSVAVVTITVFIHEHWAVFEVASHVPVSYLTG